MPAFAFSAEDFRLPQQRLTTPSHAKSTRCPTGLTYYIEHRSPSIAYHGPGLALATLDKPTSRPPRTYIHDALKNHTNQTKVRGQMEILLEACSGHKNPAFVAVAWDAVNHRLALQEHDGGSAFHEEKVEHNGDHSRGWEESKGDSGPEVEEKQEFSVRHGARRLIEDVTHSASSNQQLRLAGTFRRAIRASVSAGAIEET